jgi:hypothetical protein
MSTAQRVSRAFHRLGFLLATVTFLICGYFMVVTVMDDARRKQSAHQELLCARDKVKASNAQATIPGLKVVGLTDNLDLKSLGCTSWSRVVSREAVLNVRDEDFSYASALLISLKPNPSPHTCPGHFVRPLWLNASDRAGHWRLCSFVAFAPSCSLCLPNDWTFRGSRKGVRIPGYFTNLGAFGPSSALSFAAFSILMMPRGQAGRRHIVPCTEIVGIGISTGRHGRGVTNG